MKLGSSNSKHDLKKLLAVFWYDNPDNIKLLDDGKIQKVASGKITSVEWWWKGKRFYFGTKEQ